MSILAPTSKVHGQAKSLVATARLNGLKPVAPVLIPENSKDKNLARRKISKSPVTKDMIISSAIKAARARAQLAMSQSKSVA